MSKRKLSKQQAWRVQKIQSERALRALRKEQQIEQQLQGAELGQEQEGIVIAHFGTQLLVESRTPDGIAQQARCHIRANLGNLVTGDQVIWRAQSSTDGESQGVVVARLDRRSEILRPSPHSGLKPVAANVDLMVLVIAPEPEAHAELIDRYLVAAEISGIRPLLLLNKSDLLHENAQGERLEALLQLYASLGYEHLKVSKNDPEALIQLKETLKEDISVFVGQSGVGKSSLINALLPEEELKVGALSEARKTGKHTTTTARLYHFPSGGDLIDSPGIREFGLWHMSAEQVLSGFVELNALNGQCKFRNCQHQNEPGCAVLKALENQQLHPSRFESFKRILKQIEDNQRPY